MAFGALSTELVGSELRMKWSPPENGDSRLPKTKSTDASTDAAPRPALEERHPSISTDLRGDGPRSQMPGSSVKQHRKPRSNSLKASLTV